MNKLNHFVLKHRAISSFVFMAPALIAEILCINLPPHIFKNIVACLLVYLIVITLWLSSCFSAVLNKAVKKMYDECDPYPLLEQTQKLLTYKIKGAENLPVIIDHCVALRNIGAYKNALSMLESTDIGKYKMTPGFNIMVYYNNLSDLYDMLGDNEKADIFYDKTVKAYGRLKKGRLKNAAESTIHITTAANYYRHGEYDKAIEILENVNCNNLCNEVDSKMLCARVYLAMGLTDKAKQALMFVKEKGNKLYAVTEAEKMLKEI